SYFGKTLYTISRLQSCKKIQDYMIKAIEPPINSESDIYVLFATANEFTLIQLIDRFKEFVNLPNTGNLVIEEVDVWKCFD
ncbi:15699_t:CDS:2, partial [Dentiscutata erythropus]